jgi:hypothetical protein
MKTRLSRMPRALAMAAAAAALALLAAYATPTQPRRTAGAALADAGSAH